MDERKRESIMKTANLRISIDKRLDTSIWEQGADGVLRQMQALSKASSGGLDIDRDGMQALAQMGTFFATMHLATLVQKKVDPLGVALDNMR